MFDVLMTFFKVIDTKHFSQSSLQINKQIYKNNLVAQGKIFKRQQCNGRMVRINEIMSNEEGNTSYLYILWN